MRAYFWGIFLVLSGIFLLLKHFFNLNISTARVIVGLFLTLLGLFILLGNTGYVDNHNIIFSEKSLSYRADSDEYTIVFSRSSLDLSAFEPGDGQVEIEVNSIFSDADIILPKDAKVYVKASGAFCRTSLPDGASFSFGDHIYTDESKRENADLIINLSSVFADTRVER
ncbi:MAG: LiaF-related protein [Clostridia bacterium]|nr:LiaF-related protein [Clostridia bacterium]